MKAYRLITLFVLVAIFAFCAMPAAADQNNIDGTTIWPVAGGGTGAVPAMGSPSVPATSVSTVPVGANSSSLMGVAADSSGNIYVGNKTSLLKVDGRTFLISTVATGFSNITALACDAAGNVYIADSGKFVATSWPRAPLRPPSSPEYRAVRAIRATASRRPVPR